MNRNLLIELLSELDEKGILKPHDVSSFMLRHFPRPSYLGGDRIGWNKAMESEAKNFLVDLLNKKLIYFETSTLSNTIYWAKLEKDNSLSLGKWFDDNPFKVTLTLGGWEYLNQHKLIQSNLVANDASVRNLQSQKWVSLTTLTVALAGTVISFFALMDDRERDFRQEINKLKDQYYFLHEDAKSQGKQIDTLKQK